jgi:hypothetical protein
MTRAVKLVTSVIIVFGIGVLTGRMVTIPPAEAQAQSDAWADPTVAACAFRNIEKIQDMSATSGFSPLMWLLRLCEAHPDFRG